MWMLTFYPGKWGLFTPSYVPYCFSLLVKKQDSRELLCSRKSFFGNRRARNF